MAEQADETVATPGERCPLSGHTVTSIPHEDWIEGNPYRCHTCGSLVITYRVRQSDYPGAGRLHTHKAPRTPSALPSSGGRVIDPED